MIYRAQDNQGMKHWHKVRHPWRRQVMRCEELTQGAINLANLLDEQYVDRNTGRCWPSNERLASDLGKDQRTVQRYLAQLLETGYVRLVKIKNRRRGLCLSFPTVAEHDSQGDKKTEKTTSALSPEGDNNVVPYIEPNIEPNRGLVSSAACKFIRVDATDNLSLSEWENWVSENTEYDWNALKELLGNGEAICLPRRYPATGASEATSYCVFFDHVIRSKGKCL